MLPLNLLQPSQQWVDLGLNLWQLLFDCYELVCLHWEHTLIKLKSIIHVMFDKETDSNCTAPMYLSSRVHWQKCGWGLISERAWLWKPKFKTFQCSNSWGEYWLKSVRVWAMQRQVLSSFLSQFGPSFISLIIKLYSPTNSLSDWELNAKGRWPCFQYLC